MAVFRPTMRLENASRTLASHSTPSPVRMRVRSATHSRFGPRAVKSRSTRSPVAVWFGFCRVADAFASGSSLMPQKKNPDAAERLRAKAPRLASHLSAVHGVLHVLGHDHAEPEQAARMRDRELALLGEHHWAGPPPVTFRQEHAR